MPIPEMETLINELRSKNYKVGLLSNVIPNTAKDIREHGGYRSFDFTVLSYELGIAKPELDIYEFAMKQLTDTKPSEVVFIDDQERCLIPAREMGIRTILAMNTKQIITDVRDIIS